MNADPHGNFLHDNAHESLKADGWEFSTIEDPWQRALARLNYALRPGSTDCAWTQDLLRRIKTHVGDVERDVIASHLLASLEAEFGRSVTAVPDHLQRRIERAAKKHGSGPRQLAP